MNGTEQKSVSTYESLRDLVQQTRAIFDAFEDGIVTYDENGTIFSINRSAEGMFCLKRPAECNVRSLFWPDEKIESALFACHIYGATREENPLGLGVLELSGRRGSHRFPAEVSVSRTWQNGSAKYIAVMRDVTLRKQIEARIHRAQRMEFVRQLAGDIAHEINTPTQFVSSNIQFLQGAFDDIGKLLALFEQLVSAVRQQQPTDELLTEISHQIELADLPFLQREFPDAIEQSLDGLDRVAHTVRAFSDFSQPQSEPMSKLDINQTIENAITDCAEQFEAARINTHLDSKLPPVMGLSNQIRMAIQDILVNAKEAVLEHCEPGIGQVRIKTNSSTDRVELRIEDNGPGIPFKIRERVFDPLFTTKVRQKRFGRGLAFVYDVIVSQHNGTIDLICPPEGGTTFVISFPTAKQLGEGDVQC